ncbi:MAG: phosphoglucomutase/phosphomannomutase family protein, partial [Saprospiraceae bacterium]|nr:phosphoglucomutase/phosphomannomutase family protein [Saprospiraceae bacterium]
VPDRSSVEFRELTELEQSGFLQYVDLEAMYLDHIRAHFDMQLVEKYQESMAYDAMYGSGQNAMKKLFPDATFLHCDYNPSFLGTAPEPIDRNLRELSQTVASNPRLTFGLANDGDADRIGMYDGDGVFVDSHRLLLLLLKYLYEYKGIKTGKVVCSFSVTDKMKKLADMYGLTYVTTKIGFKYIAEIMSQEPVLVGGEESGGIAVSGHIPERDGIWTGLLLLEFMAKTGKSLKELLQDLYDQVGYFDFYRDDLHLSEEQKQRIVKACTDHEIDQLGDLKILEVDDLDGFKYTLAEDTWVMIRPSGTEPVLRVYAQAADMQEVRELLDKTKETLLSL